MPKRRLWARGPEVGPLIFGGNVFGWTVDEPKSFALLDAAVAAGLNVIDTADVYSGWVPGNHGGESETIIGKWLQQYGHRDRVVIITKVGMETQSGEKGLSRAHILRSVDASLRRLQTDYIDLYLSHVDDPGTPLEETLETYSSLIDEGKVRAIGASNYSAERLAEALEVSDRRGLPRYQVLEPRYNLYFRSDFESALEPLCVEHGLGVIPYSALGRGFLTGKYRSEADFAKSPRGSGIKPYLNERGLRILDAIDQVARNHAVTPTSVAIAWLLARPSVTAPIASATAVEQLGQLLAGTKLNLEPSEIELLNRASA